MNVNSSVVTTTVSHHCLENCHPKENSKSEVIRNIAEKVGAIALGIFSAYTSLQLFLPFVFIGLFIGVSSYPQDNQSCDDLHQASLCVHGALEQLTRVKLPKIIGLVASIGVTGCHIDHHANVFVPIVGISIGAWIGHTVWHYCTTSYPMLATQQTHGLSP